MRAYIFDIDGTLSDPAHRLHHIKGESQDWPAFYAACDQDAPIPHMVDVFKAIWYGTDSIVLFCTGRSSEIEEKTVTWLSANLLRPGERFPAEDVYMRAAGDYRPDAVVKSELMNRIKADGYEPVMVFEDRGRVAKMWREMGIPCAQVDEGDF